MRLPLFLYACCTAGAIGLLATPVAAQRSEIQVGSRIPVRSMPVDTKEQKRGLASMATCMVSKRYEPLRAFVLGEPGKESLTPKDYEILSELNCVGEAGQRIGSLYMDPVQAKGLFASALVQRDLRDVDLPDLASVPKLVHTVLRISKPAADPKVAAADQAEIDTINFMSWYGECIVRDNPSGAKSVLVTTPYSAEEGIAMRAIMTSLSSCMPKTMKFGFPRDMLRGPLAVNYYRIAAAAGTLPALGKK